ncbi:hypothetical protein L227DRAFT_574630 [Lentinus tigrinus ALCF2SS1-6]|uniref:Uncharacterized protein n=1 Tax=Lentinus tigrinus ALCF2SS1-6 TaxID=1328759 RepID=A0A5C2SBF4_9APHY|nr:hypothetical protein L227DRAFT_574630 [Lentinus tigrinus ALCF2SS1-6]
MRPISTQTFGACTCLSCHGSRYTPPLEQSKHCGVESRWNRTAEPASLVLREHLVEFRGSEHTKQQPLLALRWPRPLEDTGY